MNHYDNCSKQITEKDNIPDNPGIAMCADEVDDQDKEDNASVLDQVESDLRDLLGKDPVLRHIIQDLRDDEAGLIEDGIGEDNSSDDAVDDSDASSSNEDFDSISDIWDGGPGNDNSIEPLDPENYEGIAFDQLVGIDHVIDKTVNSMIPILKSVLESGRNIPPVAGLMISGPRGTGRTHMSLAIAAELVKDSGMKVFRVDIGDPIVEDVNIDDIKETFNYLADVHKGPAILLIDDIPGRSAFGTDPFFSKTKILEALAGELMKLVQDVQNPLVIIGTTVDPKDLPAEFFDLSLFPLAVKMEYPDVSVVWPRLLATAGVADVDPGLDMNTKLTVRELKHLLKFILLHAGDVNVKDDDIGFARSLMQAKSQAFDLPAEVPSETLDAYVGEKTIKIVKEQLLLSIEYSKLAAHYGILPAKGVFITGPMGCGKTHLAHCIAGELKWSLVQLNVGSFGSEYLHAHERQLHKMVNDWLGRQEPMVVLMDEVDNLVPLDAGNEDWAARTGNMVLLEIERLLHRKGEPLIVIAATSRPEAVNPALIRSGRLDLRIDIGFPDPREREALFRLYLGDVGRDLDVSAAVRMPYTPAEIERVAKQTLWHAFVHATQTGKQSPPNEVDLQNAIKQIPPQDKLLHNRGSVSR